MERLKAQQADVVSRLEHTRKRLEESRPSRGCSTPCSAQWKATSRPAGRSSRVQWRSGCSSSSCRTCSRSTVAVWARRQRRQRGSREPGPRRPGSAASRRRRSRGWGTSRRGSGPVGPRHGVHAAPCHTRAPEGLRIVHALIWHTRAGKSQQAHAAGGLVVIVTLTHVVPALVGKPHGESFLLGLMRAPCGSCCRSGCGCSSRGTCPAPDVPWTALIPGALFFGVGLEGLHLVTVYRSPGRSSTRPTRTARSASRYALLLWAYLLGRLITSSAVINETLWSPTKHRHPHPPASARRRLHDDLTRFAHEATGHAPEKHQADSAHRSAHRARAPARSRPRTAAPARRVRPPRQAPR